MRTLWSTAAAACALLFTATAWGAPSPAELDKARAIFREGMARYQQGHAEEARLLYLQASSIILTPNMKWNLALAEMDSDHPLEALRHLRESEADPKNDTATRAKARKFMGEVKARLGRIEVHAPPGDTVYVDGAPVELDGLDAWVVPGLHVVKTDRTPGRSLVLAAGGIEVFSVPTTTIAPEPRTAVATGPAPIATPDGSRPAPAEPGPTNTRSSTPIEPAPSHSEGVRPAVWIAGGAGALAVVSGAIFLVAAAEAHAANSDANTLRASMPPQGCPNATGCQALASDARKHDSWTTVQDVAGPATLVLAAGAGIAAIFALRPTDHEHPRDALFVPVVAPGFAGFQFARTF